MPTTALFPLNSRKFWLVFLTSALLAAIAAFRLMFLVDAGLNVEFSFSRQQALDAAARFHQQQFPELNTERTAAVFISDRDFQNYIELEAGGLEAFQALIPQTDANTHFWRVRTFTPGEKPELITAFSPQGIPVAFSYLIPDDEPGAALDETAARAIAEAGAQSFLGARFAAYARLQEQEVKQSTGRMDHTFTYEHSSLHPGAARLRLQLQVAGDKLVAINAIKFIPEAFSQRFGELRALNTQISQIANGLMGALLGLVFLCGGGIWLYRRHQLLWRRALLPAAVVATGMAAAELANLPINWMNYNTSTSAQSFLVQQFAQAGIVVVVVSLAFSTIYAVAEGLSRHAFASHPRIWDSIRPAALATPQLAGRVLGAYAWTGFFLLYAVLFLLFSSRVLHWWQPSSLNVDPNVLASWRPALAPIFNALQAGTWEECFFRGIPLAFAALLDRHFRSGKKILVLTLFAQALIFAAAHANYPQLPGYSRLVELFIPAMAFGLVYLRFGLLVGIITHFIYDLSLMSLPIFLADDASLWFDRTLIMLAGTAPLLALLWAYRKQGQLLPLADSLRNGVQPLPEAAAEPATELAGPEHSKAGAINFNGKVLLALVVLGSVLYAAQAARTPPVQWPQFQVDRAQAQVLSEQTLQEHGISLSGEWHRTTSIQAARSAAMDFIWRESGPQQVQQLLGTYVNEPFWVTTWRRFDGPVENRSEFWQVQITTDGKLLQLKHQLPEASPGASLSKEAAEARARNWINELHWARAEELELKSVSETKRPERSDWLVTFLDNSAYDHNDAHAAIMIWIAGDEISAYSRTLDIPEAWVRAQTEKASRLQPFTIINSILMLSIFGCALATYFRKHTGRKFSFRLALPWIAITVVPFLLLAWLRLDAQLSALPTTMPWSTQLLLLAGGLLLAAAALAALVFLASQALHGQRPRLGATLQQDFMTGTALAFGIFGFQALGGLLFQSTEPVTALVADYATPQPLLALVLNGIQAIASSVLFLILALGLVRFTTHTWRLVLIALLALLWWLSGAFGSREVLVGLSRLASMALIVLLTYWLIRHQHMGSAIAMLGMLVALRQLNLMAASYPAAWIQALLSAACCLVVVLLLLKHWYRHSATMGSPEHK